MASHIPLKDFLVVSDLARHNTFLSLLFLMYPGMANKEYLTLFMNG